MVKESSDLFVVLQPAEIPVELNKNTSNSRYILANQKGNMLEVH